MVMNDLLVQRRFVGADMHIIIGRLTDKESRLQVVALVHDFFDDGVEKYRDGDKVVLIFRDVGNKLKAVANSFIACLFSDPMDDAPDEEVSERDFEDAAGIVEPIEEDEEPFDAAEIFSKGAQILIPSGLYAGKTVHQAYDEHWLYALATLLLEVKKMTGLPQEELDVLYKYLVLFAKNAFEEIEDGGDDLNVKETLSAFLEAFGPFLRKELSSLGKPIQALQNLDERESLRVLVDLMEALIDRMVISIAP